MVIKKQLRRLHIFGFSACLRLPDAVWVVLLAARGFSLWQIGLAEGVFHIVSLLCEIPSGVAADLLGRRRSLAAAGVCGIISALLMAFSHHFVGVCLSMAFSALACNFISGSDEALLYDSLLQADRQDEYLAANARYVQVQNVASMLSHAASLLAGILSYIGFYLLDAAVCVVRALAALGLEEPVVTAGQERRRKHPFRDVKNRFTEHVTQIIGFFRTYPRTVWLMLADGLIGLPSYLTLMFLQQRLSELGFSTMWLGLPIMGISLSRIVGVTVGKRLQPSRLRRLYGICGLLVGAGTVLAGAASLLPAMLGAMAAAGCMDAWLLHLQKRLNGLFPSDSRATLVSVNNMAYSVLMIVVSPLVGLLGDISGTAGAGLCALGIVVAVGGLTALFCRRQ